MAIFKCKMCGGTLNVNEGMTVCECEYCGTAQTLPKLDNEKRNQLFDRANHYRMNKEFDKASVVYENILAEAPNEAEAHWGMCLCRYGIEYVVDPKTNKRIPTCHRTQFKSILEDDDYLSAVKNCDGIARAIYNSEAMYIDNVQKQILEISSKEEPFDIFICYKESDNAGNRTTDSVIAQDIYNELTNQGYKVFFARITLEDKLGSAYEPYIFAALNSSKIMLVVGTKPEYFNAVWVKNEWSRYLSLIEQGQKKTLIPCYRDITPYDLPDEFVALQSQDVSKVGYMQDLLRGITKILKLSSKNVNVNEDKENDQLINILNLGFIDYESGNKEKAENTFRLALQMDINCLGAYLGLLLCSGQSENYLKKLLSLSPEVSGNEKYFINNNNYLDFLKFFIEHNKNGNCNSRITWIYKTFLDELEKVDDKPILFFAIESKNVFSVKCLLENDAKLEERIYVEESDYQNDWSMLSRAVSLNQFDIVKLLLEYKADPNSYRIYTKQGRKSTYYVLNEAIWNAKNSKIVYLLLQHGANAEIMSHMEFDNGNIGDVSALSQAVCDDNVEATLVLLKNGVLPNSYRFLKKTGMLDVNKYFALNDAVWKSRNPKIVKMLLEYGANTSDISTTFFEDGRMELTALAEAIRTDDLNVEESENMIDILLDHGASWSDEIYLNSIRSDIKHYPFDKQCNLDKEYLRFLKSRGWKGQPIKRFLGFLFKIPLKILEILLKYWIIWAIALFIIGQIFR